MSGTKVSILGKRDVEFTDKKTGEFIQGLRLYFACENDEVEGLYADSIWIDGTKSKSLYEHLCSNLDFSGGEPIDAEFVYAVIPGRRNPQLAEINFS